MRISARNILKGTVKSIKPGVVNTEVVIDIGGTEVVAIITKASAEDLGLQEGREAYAVIKASSVMVAVESLIAVCLESLERFRAPRSSATLEAEAG